MKTFVFVSMSFQACCLVHHSYLLFSNYNLYLFNAVSIPHTLSCHISLNPSLGAAHMWDASAMAHIPLMFSFHSGCHLVWLISCLKMITFYILFSFLVVHIQSVSLGQTPELTI
jgi:hypothetical protein